MINKGIGRISRKSKPWADFILLLFLLLKCLCILQLTPKNGRCATLNEYVSTACLPETELFTEGKQCHIVGWGQTQAGGKIWFL